MKKLISILLLCGMMLSMLASCGMQQGQIELGRYELEEDYSNVAFAGEPSWNGSTDTSWYTSNPSASTFYLSDGADLKGFIELVYASSGAVDFEGKTIEMQKDINLGGKDWVIPSSDNYFKGTFDGKGHEIGGFKLTATTGKQSVLGSIGGSATVKNLRVESGSITINASAATVGVAQVIGCVVTEKGKTVTVSGVEAGGTISEKSGSKSVTYVGGVIGIVRGKGSIVIENCNSSATISSTKSYVAGILGGTEDGVVGVTVKGCNNFGKISAGNNVAGIVGSLNSGTIDVVIENCVNYANVTIIESSGNGQAAGILAHFDGTNGGLTVTGCKNSGIISYTGAKNGGAWMGGIVGYVYGTGASQLGSVTLRDCHNTGALVANRTSGGLAGFIQRCNTLVIENCSVNAALTFNIMHTGNFYVGGLVGIIHTNSSTEAKISNCTVSGHLTVNETQAVAVYAGGLFGAIRSSSIALSDCDVDVEFSKKNCEEDDVINVALGLNENGSATLTTNNVTYKYHNGVADAENFLILESDTTVFKPLGQQFRKNADGTYDIRFVFGVVHHEADDALVGADLVLKELGTKVNVSTTSESGNTVLANLKGGNVTYNPGDYGCKYFYTTTIKGIPADKVEFEDFGNYTAAYVKDTIISILPFAKVNADAEATTSMGISDFAKTPETYTFEVKDFSSFLPEKFEGVQGILSKYNVTYNPASGLGCQNYLQLGSNDQYVLQKNCTCGGDVCKAGWGSTGAIAYKKNANVPYHYYIDTSSYANSKYFGEELDRYEAYHTWTFEVAEDGYYEICFRIRLNGSEGGTQTRYALVQFDDECYSEQTEFYYNVVVRDGSLRDNAANHDSYLSNYGKYLTKGTHSITFRVPYDTEEINKNISFHIRDIYLVKGAAEPSQADIPMLDGATLYDGNFDSTCTYILNNTTKKTLDAYRQKLEAAGYVLQEERTTEYKTSAFDSENHKQNTPLYNNFYLYTNADYMIYVYYTEGARKIRVVVDDIAEYEKYVEVRNENKTYETVTTPLFAMLDIGGVNDANPSWTVTNGMCYVFRLSDGRFVIVDGGYWFENDTNGAGVKRLYDWLQANDHLPGENNKLTIAAWIITHHHSDHISVEWKFEEMYGQNGKVEIQNYLYNFPSYDYAQTVSGSTCNPDYYSKWFPNMHNLMQRNNNLIAHTGFNYQFADCNIDILFTHEDFYPEKISSFNNSSTVYKITFAGKTFLIAGDLEEPGQKAANKQCGTMLESDFLQVTHHGCNGQIEFFKYIVGLDANGKFNTDTIIVWPLPKGEDMSWYEGTSARAIAMRWLRDMFRNENDLANDNIFFASENYVFTDFN
ncbi:MAG: hypothetical protein IJX28_06910 [Clostridia bacterium]|nr:hypothetical protein [Clostridia bacterium]